jgi:hypothetical protein
MDELWQRYRSFWRPVLFGLGVFLLGLIVVHVITPNPEDAANEAASAANQLKNLTLPKDGVGTTLRANGEAFRDATQRLAQAFDPGSGGDPVQHYVRQALIAAYARGGVGPAAFDGDAAAAAQAMRDAERLAVERTTLFKTGNANVAFSSLLSDVWNVLRTRANRADMDLEAELLGFAAVSSVPRGELERRLANLALVARVVDVAIRHGAKSVDNVLFENPRGAGPDAFLQEWPVKITLTADAPCVEAVLDLLTDPKSPTALSTLEARQPQRAKAPTGLVELTLTVDCLAVKPAAPLDLDAQEGRP